MPTTTRYVCGQQYHQRQRDPSTRTGVQLHPVGCVGTEWRFPTRSPSPPPPMLTAVSLPQLRQHRRPVHRRQSSRPLGRSPSAWLKNHHTGGSARYPAHCRGDRPDDRCGPRRCQRCVHLAGRATVDQQHWRARSPKTGPSSFQLDARRPATPRCRGPGRTDVDDSARHGHQRERRISRDDPEHVPITSQNVVPSAVSGFTPTVSGPTPAAPSPVVRWVGSPTVTGMP